MSDEVEQRIAGLLKDPHVDPYGNPVPALDELGIEPAPNHGLDGLDLLGDVATLEERRVVVRRISEHLQPDPALLRRLREAGVEPGATVVVTAGPHGIHVGDESFDSAVANHIFVTRD